MRIDCLQRDLLGLVLLAAGSLGIGLLVNLSRQHPLPLIYQSPESRLGEVVARVAAKSPATGRPAADPSQWQNISLDEFQELVSEQKAIIIDARPTLMYRAGHVPGALNIPREDFESAYAGARVSLESEKDRAIVVYCSAADCKDSELVVGALTQLGSRHFFIYREGWEEWLRAGLPQETKPRQ